MTVAPSIPILLLIKAIIGVGSSCGYVGRVVASNLEVRGSNPLIGKICKAHFSCRLY